MKRNVGLPAAWWVMALVAGTLLLAGCDRGRELPRDTQVVDGITIDIGVVPASLVQGHGTDQADPKAMHGGAPKGGLSHHLVVALFDAKTGARIVDARVRAAAGIYSFDHEPDTLLEPMQIANTTTYGGFFQMWAKDSWTIHLLIERPGFAPVRAKFRYEHPGD